MTGAQASLLATSVCFKREQTINSQTPEKLNLFTTHSHRLQARMIALQSLFQNLFINFQNRFDIRNVVGFFEARRFLFFGNFDDFFDQCLFVVNRK